jgi:hypothetical protein
MRIDAIKRYEIQPNLKKRISEALSKKIRLEYIDGSTPLEFKGVRKMAKHFKCSHKTINKAIKNKTIFKGLGYIKTVI